MTSANEPFEKNAPNTLKPTSVEAPKETRTVVRKSIWNDSRFWIAALLILGMMIILIITVLQAQYTQTTQLAGIFSGWVTSIIAFYFMGQTTAKAQTQIQASSQSQAKAESKVQSYEKKMTRVRDVISLSEPTARADAVQKQAWDKIKTIIDEIP